MGRIQANTGLVTGIDIQGTVDKLIELQGIPRDAATTRLKALTDKQTIIAELTAAVISIQLAAKNLGKAELFKQTTVTSSNSGLLAAAVSPGGSPVPGNYQFTPIRLAQAQHVISQSFASSTSPVGAGTLTLRQGGSLSSPVKLAMLNGGAGVERGKIRIADRSGSSAVIDLRYANTIEDVLQAINSSETINVTASTTGDRLQLVDNTGQSISNLRVQEVGAGNTAADLGLSLINTAASTATGNDVLALYAGLSLSVLNDGTGVSFNPSLADMRVTLADGSTVDVDFQKLGQAAGKAAATLDAPGIDGDLLFTAVQTGAEFDGVAIQFTSSGTVTAGNETVAYDANAKTLTFDIEAGVTTANDIIAALAADSAASSTFTAATASGGTGTGPVASSTATTTGGAAVADANERSLGDVLATINAAAPTRLRAQLSASGDRIELVDLTGRAGTLSVASLNGGSTAEDLALVGASSGATLAGGRLLGGLNSVLLSSLQGGRGFGTLGLVSITDRSGVSATIDLSSAETVDDVLAAINSASVGVTAELNSAKDGIQLVDTTGAAASNLIVADGDATSTASRLGLAVNAAVSSKNGGDLARRIVGRETLLMAFNRGAGVRLGSVKITDSSGAASALNLATLGVETIGEVLDAINNLGLGVEARINDTGDGIVLVDTAGGTGKLVVEDVGTGKSAADLKIAGQSVSTTINGVPAEQIDGSTSVRITLDADDSLSDLAAKINDANTGLTASLFFDGASYRLSLQNSETGVANAWTIDGSGLGMEFEEIAADQDALVTVGPPGSGSLLVSSATNTVDDAIPGVRVTLSGTSVDPVQVTVSQDVPSITAKIKSFIEQYNKLLEKLEKVDFFQPEDGTRGILHGSSETLRIKSDLSRLLSGRFVGSNYQSLGSLGVSFKDDGSLEFNEQKFTTAYNADAEAVAKFFSDAETGFAKKIDEVVESLAGVDNSLLINRTVALQTQVEQLSMRIELMNFQLDKSKERLLLQFFRLESTIGKLQNTFGSIQTALSNATNLYNNLN